MKGLELSRKYYEAFGAPMLAAEFPELAGTLAVGLVGPGSECFGFDDEISADHDFEPGFCLFVPDELDSRTAFRLERAYAKLPAEFMGFSRQKIAPVGGSRRGVIRVSDFYRNKTGFALGPDTPDEWFSVPEYALAEATNGELFAPGDGLFAAIREKLLSPPRDVRLKRLAGRLLLMAQSGQYNYGRCLAHGETAAAQLAMNEFVTSAMGAIFLLNGRYMPYYKWSFRALRGLPLLGDQADILEYLLTTGNGEDYRDFKAESVEDLAQKIIAVLQNRGLTDAVCGDLEKHAYSVNDRIADPDVRNRHVLAAV